MQLMNEVCKLGEVIVLHELGGEPQVRESCQLMLPIPLGIGLRNNLLVPGSFVT